jgi:hypothetical protein
MQFFFRQLAIEQKVLRGTVDLARFLVVLNPPQEHGSYGHRGLGADRLEVLPQEEPSANHDAHLPVVCHSPPVQGRWAGLFLNFHQNTPYSGCRHCAGADGSTLIVGAGTPAPHSHPK